MNIVAYMTQLLQDIQEQHQLQRIRVTLLPPNEHHRQERLCVEVITPVKGYAFEHPVDGLKQEDLERMKDMLIERLDPNWDPGPSILLGEG